MSTNSLPENPDIPYCRANDEEDDKYGRIRMRIRTYCIIPFTIYRYYKYTTRTIKIHGGILWYVKSKMIFYPMR